MYSTKSIIRVFSIVIIIVITTVYKSNANYQISKVGGINNILHNYVKSLFKTVTSIYKVGMLQNPMDWCMDNIEDYKKHISIRVKKKEYCEKYLKRHYIFVNSKDKAFSALENGYFNLTEDCKSWNVISKAYYMYLHNTFLPLIVENNAIRPLVYCESNTDCIDQITINGGINVNSTAQTAFSHVYFHLHDYDTKALDNVILRQYSNELCKAVISSISSYQVKILKGPMEWCKENIQDDRLKELEDNEKEMICKTKLKNSVFKTVEDGLKALSYAYFEIKLHFTKMSNTIKKYYMYLIGQVLPYIPFTNALGPQEYCNNLNSTLNYNIVENYQINYLSTQLFNGQKQPNNSDEQIQTHNLYSNMLSGTIIPLDVMNPATKIPSDVDQNPTDNTKSKGKELYYNLYNDYYSKLRNTSGKGQGNADNVYEFSIEKQSPNSFKGNGVQLYSGVFNDIRNKMKNISVNRQKKTVGSNQLPIDQQQSDQQHPPSYNNTDKIYQNQTDNMGLPEQILNSSPTLEFPPGPNYMDPFNSSQYNQVQIQTGNINYPEQNSNLNPISEFTYDPSYIDPSNSIQYDQVQNQAGYMDLLRQSLNSYPTSEFPSGLNYIDPFNSSQYNPMQIQADNMDVPGQNLNGYPTSEFASGLNYINPFNSNQNDGMQIQAGNMYFPEQRLNFYPTLDYTSGPNYIDSFNSNQNNQEQIQAEHLNAQGQEPYIDPNISSNLPFINTIAQRNISASIESYLSDSRNPEMYSNINNIPVNILSSTTSAPNQNLSFDYDKASN